MGVIQSFAFVGSIIPSPLRNEVIDFLKQLNNAWCDGIRRVLLKFTSKSILYHSAPFSGLFH